MGLPQARSGALNRMIEIQYDSGTTQDDVGQPVANWKRLGRAWAAVESTDTNERFQAGQEVGHKLKVFTIRYRNDIVFKQRIIFQDEIYNIRSIKAVDRKGRDGFLEILGEVIDGATK